MRKRQHEELRDCLQKAGRAAAGLLALAADLAREAAPERHVHATRYLAMVGLRGEIAALAAVLNRAAAILEPETT